eukprot:6193567-Pleurochrysis_carterae.AAC.1
MAEGSIATGASDATAPACRCVVVADDLGISHSRNTGIILALREGAVTAASILANGPAVQHAIRLVCAARLQVPNKARRGGRCGTGVLKSALMLEAILWPAALCGFCWLLRIASACT